MDNDRKAFIKDLLVLFLALGALVCAAINLHIALNMLEDTDSEDTDPEE